MPDTARPLTAIDPNTELCTLGGTDHDFRPRTWRTAWNVDQISWVCVWCHGIACGNYGDPDPCFLICHHKSGHRSRSGTLWPLGSLRPDIGRPA